MEKNKIKYYITMPGEKYEGKQRGSFLEMIPKLKTHGQSTFLQCVNEYKNFLIGSLEFVLINVVLLGISRENEIELRFQSSSVMINDLFLNLRTIYTFT